MSLKKRRQAGEVPGNGAYSAGAPDEDVKVYRSPSGRARGIPRAERNDSRNQPEGKVRTAGSRANGRAAAGVRVEKQQPPQAPVIALKGFIKLVILILVAIVLINVTRYVYNTTYTIFSDKPNLNGEKREYTINIEPGMTLDRIADILYINGIVPNKGNFKIQAKLGGLEKTMQAGEHKVDSFMTSEEIIRSLSEIGAKVNE